jgi:hypothetical protein
MKMMMSQILFYVLAENGAVLLINNSRAAKNVKPTQIQKPTVIGFIANKTMLPTKLNKCLKYR